MRTRRRTALAVAVCATVFLAVTAAIVVTPGIWIPAPVTMFTSPVSATVLALIAAAVALQLGVTLAWAQRATLKRRYLGSAAAVEVVLGAGIFWMAPVLHGIGPAPELGSEPIYGMPSSSLWGLLCLSFVGLMMFVAVIIHGSPSRQATRGAEPKSA